MLEAAVIVLRLLQYAGATVLMGSSLFFLYALPRDGAASAAKTPWARSLLLGAGALLAISTLLGVAAQASLLAGSIREGLKVETLAAMVAGMNLGKAAAVRAAAGLLATLLLLILQPGRTAWSLAAALGALAAASLAWMGHGAASEGSAGRLHLASDILHSWAAAVWIGALVAFLRLLRTRDPGAETSQAIHRALHGFSGIGTGLVAVLVGTGLVNSWFLVGIEHIEGLWTTTYGRLLCLKLVLFLAMVLLAAANRFRLTPALARTLENKSRAGAATAVLARSVLLETAVGFAVLALVAGFGTLPPPSAM